jgi:hypothetical protein
MKRKILVLVCGAVLIASGLIYAGIKYRSKFSGVKDQAGLDMDVVVSTDKNGTLTGQVLKSGRSISSFALPRTCAMPHAQVTGWNMDRSQAYIVELCLSGMGRASSTLFALTLTHARLAMKGTYADELIGQSSEADRLAFAQTDGSTSFRTADGKEYARMEYQTSHVEFSPDGDRVFFITTQRAVERYVVYEISTGKTFDVTSWHTANKRLKNIHWKDERRLMGTVNEVTSEFDIPTPLP